MASSYATSLAIFIHFVLKLAIFLDPGALSHSNATHFQSIPSYLMLLSVLLLTKECQLFPQRYIHRFPILFSTLVETCLLLIIIEFSMVFAWTRVETYIEIQLKKICTLNAMKLCFASEWICVTLAMILLSLGIFYIVAVIMDLHGSFKRQMSDISRSTMHFFDYTLE